tara:strand:- start:446 stop:865 length:420 start_codon:yes stop_codon:yes gene_type:complete
LPARQALLNPPGLVGRDCAWRQQQGLRTRNPGGGGFFGQACKGFIRRSRRGWGFVAGLRDRGNREQDRAHGKTGRDRPGGRAGGLARKRLNKSLNAFPQNGLPGFTMIPDYFRGVMVKEWFRPRAQVHKTVSYGRNSAY